MFKNTACDIDFALIFVFDFIFFAYLLYILKLKKFRLVITSSASQDKLVKLLKSFGFDYEPGRDIYSSYSYEIYLYSRLHKSLYKNDDFQYNYGEFCKKGVHCLVMLESLNLTSEFFLSDVNLFRNIFSPDEIKKKLYILFTSSSSSNENKFNKKELNAQVLKCNVLFDALGIQDSDEKKKKRFLNKRAIYTNDFFYKFNEISLYIKKTVNLKSILIGMLVILFIPLIALITFFMVEECGNDLKQLTNSTAITTLATSPMLSKLL